MGGRMIILSLNKRYLSGLSVSPLPYSRIGSEQIISPSSRTLKILGVSKLFVLVIYAPLSFFVFYHTARNKSIKTKKILPKQNLFYCLTDYIKLL